MIEITYILLAVIVVVILIDLYLKRKNKPHITDIEKVEDKNKKSDLKQGIYYFVFQKKLIKAFFFIYAIITILFIVFNTFNNDTTARTNWQEFNQQLLKPGKVDKIVVLNKEKVYIYLKKEFLSEERFKHVSKKPFSDAKNYGPHFYFEIGSVELFNNDLKDAQVGFENKDKIFPFYETQSLIYFNRNWVSPSLLIFSFFCLLIFISFLCIQVVRYHIKNKKYILACFSIFISLIIISSPLTYALWVDGVIYEYIEKFDAKYINWEKKEFTVNRWYPECSNSEKSKFKYTIELKYEDEKVLYKLAIVSSSKGVSDITEVECYVLGGNKKSFLLIDEEGYLLHKLTSQNFQLTSGYLPLKDDDWGEYYIDRGEFYMPRNSFKKIKGFKKE